MHFVVGCLETVRDQELCSCCLFYKKEKFKVCLLPRVLKFLLTFPAATTKDDYNNQEWHCCRCFTALVKQKLYRFLWIDWEWSQFVLPYFVKSTSKVWPSESEVKWISRALWLSLLLPFIFGQSIKKFKFLGVSRATRQQHFKMSSTGNENEPTIAVKQ